MREQRSIFSFLFFFPELEEPNHDDKLVGGAGKISILLIKINKFDVEVYGKLLGKNKLYTEYMCIGIRQEKHFNDLSAAGNFFFCRLACCFQINSFSVRCRPKLGNCFLLYSFVVYEEKKLCLGTLFFLLVVIAALGDAHQIPYIDVRFSFLC